MSTPSNKRPRTGRGRGRVSKKSMNTIAVKCNLYIYIYNIHYDVLLGVNAAVIHVNTEEHINKAIIVSSIFKLFLHIHFRIGMFFIPTLFWLWSIHRRSVNSFVKPK